MHVLVFREGAGLDANKLTFLYRHLGDREADLLVCDAMEDLALALARVGRAQGRGDLDGVSGQAVVIEQLGARIGLDDAGVMQSSALGGSVFGVGKYLSPRLYVGYGVSLLGTGQVLTLKYLLRKGFDITIESSTVENKGSVNWRTER